jgi:hypothetical protein
MFWNRPGGVAQLGERLLCKQEVIGSIPFTSTTAPPPPAKQALPGDRRTAGSPRATTGISTTGKHALRRSGKKAIRSGDGSRWAGSVDPSRMALGVGRVLALAGSWQVVARLLIDG